MRAKPLIAAIGLTVFGLVSVAGTASAGTPADTRVTIKTQNGDFWGAVFTSRPLRCARDRKIVVFHQLGAEQNPATDDRIASDLASLSGDRYEWNTGNTGRFGKFYARAGKTPDCKADSSETVRSVRSP